MVRGRLTGFDFFYFLISQSFDFTSFAVHVVIIQTGYCIAYTLPAYTDLSHI